MLWPRLQRSRSATLDATDDVAGADGTRARLRQGLERHRAGDLPAAARAYDAVLAASPEHTDALHLRGLVAHAAGDLALALALLGRAVAHAASPQHLANLAMVLTAAGRHQEAVDACVRAVAGRADYPEAWNTLGVALAALERLEPALAAYGRAIDLRPDYAEAHLNRGNVLGALWRCADAEESFRSAFALRPDFNPPPASPRVVYIATDRQQPGSIYRCDRMAEAARTAGWTAEVVALGAADERHVRAATVIVLWRVELSPQVSRLIAFARAGGSRIGLDVDDLITEPDLARTEVVDGIRTLGSTEAQVRTHFTRVRQTLAAADFATCTTAELAHHLRRAPLPVWELPNGFDAATWSAARAALRAWRRQRSDRLTRIGYAGGTRTHQRDMARAETALARVLRARPDTRLVLFRSPLDRAPLVSLDDLPELRGCAEQIEWRDMVPLAELPAELARFDINIAPLETANPFVEAKSELKYFEAALVSVPTIASPTGPFRRAIAPDLNGLLAADEAAWFTGLERLLDDPDAHARIGRAAYHDALWRFGPQLRARRVASLLAQLQPGAGASGAFAAALTERMPPLRPIDVPASEIRFESDRGGDSPVTITVASYNYADFMIEALDSVATQGLADLDLVVVDDGSSDASVARALDWTRAHATRFRRAAVLVTRANAGLGGNRNVGFDWAETPWVLPLDADNRLLPDCAERLLRAAERGEAAFAYPAIRQFGASGRVLDAAPFQPQRLCAGNYIDAMALVAKWAWAAAGGYYVDRAAMGWEDFDLWCSLAELGLHGVPVGEPLAEYRVHARAMTETMVEVPERKQRLVAFVERRHPWLRLQSREPDPRRAADRAG